MPPPNPPPQAGEGFGGRFMGLPRHVSARGTFPLSRLRGRDGEGAFAERMVQTRSSERAEPQCVVGALLSRVTSDSTPSQGLASGANLARM